MSSNNFGQSSGIFHIFFVIKQSAIKRVGTWDLEMCISSASRWTTEIGKESERERERDDGSVTFRRQLIYLVFIMSRQCLDGIWDHFIELNHTPMCENAGHIRLFKNYYGMKCDRIKLPEAYYHSACISASIPCGVVVEFVRSNKDHSRGMLNNLVTAHFYIYK